MNVRRAHGRFVLAVGLLTGGLAMTAPAARGDTLYLKNGRRMSGTVISQTDQHVILDVGAGTVNIELAEVQRIELDESSQASPSSPTATALEPGIPGADSAAPPTADELSQLVDTLLPIIADLRGLKPTGPIRRQIADKATIRQRLDEVVARQATPEQIVNEGKALKRFGLIPAEMEYQTYVLELYTQQIAGMYNQQTKTLYLADWIPAVLQEGVIAHELVHALQDQHFNLTRYLDDSNDDSDDSILARSAVVEGEATAVMLDYQLRALDLTVMSAAQKVPNFSDVMMEAIKQMNPKLAGQMTFVEESMQFPYLQGVGFVFAIRKDHPWSALAQCYQDPPRSSEQILHPEKYLSQRDNPVTVPVPTLKPPFAGQWQRRYEATLGEFGTRAVLRRFLSTPQADSAAAGWGGDRFALYESSPTQPSLLLWCSRWDTEQDAQEFEKAYRAVIASKYPHAQAVRGAPDAWLTEQADVALRQQGRSVIVVEGAPTGEAGAMVEQLLASNRGDEL